MLTKSYTPDTKLALFFNEISEGDRRIEVAREMLGRQYLFEPYLTFSYISKGKTYISANDLLKFCRYFIISTNFLVQTILMLILKIFSKSLEFMLLEIVGNSRIVNS